MPYVIIHACQILQKNWICWKCVTSLQLIFIYIETVETVALKQFNSSTTIHTSSWLGSPEVTHPTGVQKLPGSIPGFGKDFYVWFSVLWLLCFSFFVQNTLFVTKFCNSFWNAYKFSMLNKLQMFWTIIRVSIYRPIIFNIG